jgi:hypothetical protein
MKVAFVANKLSKLFHDHHQKWWWWVHSPIFLKSLKRDCQIRSTKAKHTFDMQSLKQSIINYCKRGSGLSNKIWYSVLQKACIGSGYLYIYDSAELGCLLWCKLKKESPILRKIDEGAFNHNLRQSGQIAWALPTPSRIYQSERAFSWSNIYSIRVTGAWVSCSKRISRKRNMEGPKTCYTPAVNVHVVGVDAY